MDLIKDKCNVGVLLDEPQETPEDVDINNGFILNGQRIPTELIAKILSYVDHKSLRNSQFVCKRWWILMESYVWKKKAEMIMGCSLQTIKDAPWSVFYTICSKKPFNRNLVKNHSGEYGVDKYWEILGQRGWKVENPPVGVPALPDTEPIFQGKPYCFATTYYDCSKQQTIELAAEGLNSVLLDKFQPPIVVSEWYSCRYDCPAWYKCSVTLLRSDSTILDTFQFDTCIENDAQNKWHQVTYEFKNYGPGLASIIFCHGGRDKLFWAGHYGSKMAGASVCVMIPKNCTHKETTPEPIVQTQTDFLDLD